MPQEDDDDGCLLFHGSATCFSRWRNVLVVVRRPLPEASGKSVPFLIFAFKGVNNVNDDDDDDHTTLVLA